MKHLLILTLLFTGCYSAKKAAEQVKKANDNYPEVVAKTARDLYPCTELLKPDTVLAIKDSLIYIECPELVKNDYISTTDTIIVRDSIYRIVKVPVKVQVQTKYITSWYEDSSKIKIMALTIDAKEKELVSLNNTFVAEISAIKNDLQEMKGKRDYWRTRFFILAAIFGVAILLRVKRII